MDIRYTNGDFQFLCRVSVLIFNRDQSKVLLFNVEGRQFYLIPGGKVHELEESVDAAKREVKEELGWENLDYSFLAISEEMVNDKGYHNQQINLIYKAIYQADIVETKFKGLEGDWINFEWVDVKNIDSYDVYPSSVKDMVRDPNRIYHTVENLIK